VTLGRTENFDHRTAHGSDFLLSAGQKIIQKKKKNAKKHVDDRSAHVFGRTFVRDETDLSRRDTRVTRSMQHHWSYCARGP
jgi:hypothetical protein